MAEKRKTSQSSLVDFFSAYKKKAKPSDAPSYDGPVVPSITAGSDAASAQTSATEPDLHDEPMAIDIIASTDLADNDCAAKTPLEVAPHDGPDVSSSVSCDPSENSAPAPEVGLDLSAEEPVVINISIESAESVMTGTSSQTSDDEQLMHDISDVVEAIRCKKPISDAQKAYLIKNRTPGKNFSFPGKLYKDKREKKGTISRHCCYDWFEQFDFISYSVSQDGLFCLPCVLFPMPARKGQRAKVLITTPCGNWKDANHDLKNHSTLEYHQNSRARLEAFMRTHDKPASRVDQIMSFESSKTIAKNRRFLESIIRCIELCGRQGIAMRGHRDDGNILDSDEERNMGNFKALVKLVSRTDTDLREHLESCKKTASYISKTTQNDLLDCITEFIQEEIVHVVKSQSSGQFYGIVADEVTDCSNWEQLGIIVRYIKNDEPVERLVEYVKCSSITGEDIADLIIESLKNLGLDPGQCRCQTYDGAGNMAGKHKGAFRQFQMKTENEKAIYFHCASHELNLALSRSCKVPEVQNLVCLMQSVGLFFKFSPKRQCTFEVSIEKISKNQGKNANTMKQKLKPLCETRWVERHSAFDDLKTLYEHLLDCLDFISLNEKARFDPKTVTEASGLSTQLSSSKFLISFTICHYIFGFTKGLSRQLQGTSMDIVRAYDLVDDVIKELEKIRENATTEFSELFAKACVMSEVAQMPITKPRLAGRQTLRTNVPAESVEEYYRRAIFIPFIDSLKSQLEDRFCGKSHDAVKAMLLIPTNLSNLKDEDLDKIKGHYGDDLPYPSDLSQELRLWKRFWESKQKEEVPDMLAKTIQNVVHSGVEKVYPNILAVLRIMLTFSATAASVERTNSALRFVKNTYRSTMTEERFNALVLLFVHRDILLDYGKIIDKYARKYPRRMLFVNPLME